LKSDEARRALEDENRRPKRVVADQALDIQVSKARLATEWRPQLSAPRARRAPRAAARLADAIPARRGRYRSILNPHYPSAGICLFTHCGGLRDERLNESWFVRLAGAPRAIEASRTEYNGARPQSGLALRTPAEFA
jgi:hypothetical protein